jgi:hypothetical protein
VTNVARRRVSPRDERTAEQLAFGGITGGDRMLHHGYGPTYARYLRPFLGGWNLTVAEFGILKGTGLAMWCDLFPDARVIGLDIDIGHFEEHRSTLERRGTFRQNKPELHEYDQLVSGQDRLRQILKGSTLDVVIDDGPAFDRVDHHDVALGRAVLLPTLRLPDRGLRRACSTSAARSSPPTTAAPLACSWS